MRVLHIGKFYPPAAGGMERFLGDLAEAQARAGHAVAAVVHQRRPRVATADETIAGVRVVRVRHWGELVYAPIAPGFRRAVAKACRDFRPDVLHLHLPNLAAPMLLGLHALRHVPWVIHWHADVVASRIDRRLAAAYRLYRPFESAVLRRAARVIATSEAYLESSPAIWPCRTKVDVVPLGLDLRRLPEPSPELRAWAEAQWRPDGGLRVLTVGRLTYYKGHEALLRAAARDPNVQAAIVGGGQLQQRIDRLLGELMVRRRVTLHGYLDDPHTQALLATCDAFVLPSLERTEAFGIVQMEAMRYGKPLITSDIPGSGVSVPCIDGVTGLLVPVNDAPALAAAMRKLEDPALRERLGEAGRRRVTDQFAIERVAEAIDGVYAQAHR